MEQEYIMESVTHTSGERRPTNRIWWTAIGALVLLVALLATITWYVDALRREATQQRQQAMQQTRQLEEALSKAEAERQNADAAGKLAQQRAEEATKLQLIAEQRQKDAEA